MIDLSQLLGIEYYTFLTDAMGNGHIVYHLPYIVSAIFFLMSMKAVYTWITILVKAGCRMGAEK